MVNKITIQDIQGMVEDYSSINEFISKFPKVTFAEFDHYSVSDMSLFVVREDINFEEIDKTIDYINSCLPAINRIFIKPIIQLVEIDELVPIEAVRTVNNKTMQHIARHSELWDNITEDGIKPQKLMSRIYQDNYSIYENVVFARAINEILSFLKQNKRLFKNLMYVSKILEFNILERVNHLDYFLAIGKLHTGYIRGFDKYYDSIRPVYEKLNIAYDKISSKLKYRVYKKNKNFKGKLVLRQTNILHMQKDYHKIYNLLKYFDKKNITYNELSDDEIKAFSKNYFDYCNMLLLFSVMHFGFKCDKDMIIDLVNTDSTFANRKWTLNIKKMSSDENDYIILEITKDKTYRIIFEPLAFGSSKDHSDTLYFNECITLSPVEDLKNATYISIYDIDSFRKFQQILLRAMVYSDTTFDACPFCEGKLKKLEHPDKNDIETYICKSCNNHIGLRKCDIEDKNYYYTDIQNYDVNKYNDDEELSMSVKYHFRNITDMTTYGEVICPICGKVHNEK